MCQPQRWSVFPPAPPWWVLCPQLCLPGWPSQARGRAGLAGGLTLSVMWAVSPVWQRRVDACLIDGNTAVRLSFLRLAPAVNIYPTFVLHQDDIAVLVMGENNNAQRPRTIASCEATPPPGHAPTRPRPPALLLRLRSSFYRGGSRRQERLVWGPGGLEASSDRLPSRAFGDGHGGRCLGCPSRWPRQH